MNEKELEGAKKLIENKDVKKGSYSFIGNSNITYADIKILLDYIKQLEQENQQLKEQLQQKEEEIKELCKKIKVNEKSRRKMQKSLMEKIQEIEKARKEAIEFLFIVYGISADYDGFNDAAGLKAVIDDIARYAKQAKKELERKQKSSDG